MMKSTNQAVKQEFSAGGVVYKKSVVSGQPSVVYLLGKHSGYHKWVLPKGLIEEGEDPKNTAIREIEEEMGVKARLVRSEPISDETYFYYADLKEVASSKKVASKKPVNQDQSARRVAKYQEQGGRKTKIFKTVTFYLLEYVSGEPQDHDWEMSEVGWFDYETALKMLSFAGEKMALKKANQILPS